MKWRKLVVVTKILISDEFWRNLLNSYFLTNENFLQPIYHKKHSILDGEKMAKFGICGKVFAKVCTFWQMKQEILLDCDQSNVLLACIIFFCILLKAFSFLSACIRDLASNWDLFNIILIVTGVEVIILENVSPKFTKYCSILRTERKNFQ